MTGQDKVPGQRTRKRVINQRTNMSRRITARRGHVVNLKDDVGIAADALRSVVAKLERHGTQAARKRAVTIINDLYKRAKDEREALVDLVGGDRAA